MNRIGYFTKRMNFVVVVNAGLSRLNRRTFFWTIAESGNYAIIFDTASGAAILYTDPKYDKSDEVLEKLGYKN